MNRKERARLRKSNKRRWWILGFAALLVVGWMIFEIFPNPLHKDPDWKGLTKPIFIKGEILPYSAIGTGDSLQLPLPVLQEQIDPKIRYEEATQSVILTTDRNLVQLQSGSKDAQLNMKSVQLRFAPQQEGDILYVPLAPLKETYGINVYEDPTTGAVMLLKAGEKVQYAHTVTGGSDQTVALRAEADIHSRIYKDVPDNARLRIWETGEGWYTVQLDNGYVGYMQSDNVVLDDLETVSVPQMPDSRVNRDWAGKKVNLTWEAVYERQPDTTKIGELPGVNVVSPTWFEIVDNTGNVRSKADMHYVNWAHNRNKEVWGLVTNNFDADMTTGALSTYENRSRVISQLLEYANLYQLDGINIDFESVHTKDGPNVTQFVRELRPLALQKNLVLSMDVTPKSNSELWSKFLDREALAPSLDYMMLMAYDEHWAASPKSGSVASLPWVEKAVNRVLEEDEVPANKLILGVPLYARVWTEKTEDGQTKVSSKALGMNGIAELIKEKKLSPKLDSSTGQNYVEYQQDGALKRIWIEDEVSLQARVELAQKLNLGGVASWTRSLGDDRAWSTLSKIEQ